MSKTHKTSKTSGKHEKIACATKAQKQQKWRFERVWKKKERLLHVEWPKTRGHLTLPLIIYKIVTLPLRFTKMPLWALNVDPLTLLTWKWHGNDVEMMWWLSSTEYWRPSSKISSPKYLKIIKKHKLGQMMWN